MREMHFCFCPEWRDSVFVCSYAADRGQGDQDGDFEELVTAAVPNETFSVHVTPTSSETSAPCGPTASTGGHPGKNTELNDTARNTNDVNKIRRLVGERADLMSTNGPEWRHTAMHQAAYHNRPEVLKVLIELSRQKNQLIRILDMDSNPCGRGSRGTPLELARGGGHGECVRLLEEAAQSLDGPTAKEQNQVTYPYQLGGWIWGIAVSPDESYCLVGCNYPHGGSPHPIYKVDLQTGSEPSLWP